LVFGTIAPQKRFELRTVEGDTSLKRIAVTLLITLFLSPSTAFSQTRRRSSQSSPQSTTAAQRAAQLRRTQGAQKVADQIKHLTRFTYLLGGVASGIAAVDEAVRRNEASPAIVERNQQSKATVRSSIQGFREALDRLEIEFRTTPELQPYYIKLAGVAAGAATSEEQAAAGQFDRAGRTLLDVIGRLADVLVVMRQ
jgi:hypothetical protein